MNYNLIICNMEIEWPSEPASYDKYKFNKWPDWETTMALSEMLELCCGFPSLEMKIISICLS